MAQGHYTWLHSVPEALNLPAEISTESEKLIWALILGGALIYFARRAQRSKDGVPAGDLVVPEEKLTTHGFFNLFVEGFLKFHDSILGVENRKYASFPATIFLFILVANLAGLIPGVAAVTTTVWVNVALSLSVFIYFNYLGIRAHGAWNYFKHFFGPVLLLAWLVAPLELLSIFLRIFTLNFRLYWNINVDHIVLATFSDLLPVGLPLPFYLLGFFVCVVQAFVFSLLTIIYVLLATQHEEEH